MDLKGDKGDTGDKGDKGDKGETGTQGIQGKTGEKGKDGSDGVSPTVSISKTGTITTIAITDANGTQTATISDGKDADSDTQTVLSENLFDKSAATHGGLFYYGGSGFQIVTQTNQYYHYVPLRGSGTYRTKFQKSQHSSTGTRIALVNENNEWVQNINGTVSETYTDANYVDFEFTITQAMISNGAKKIAFDAYGIYIDEIMIVKDIEYPKEYIPYGYIEVTTESGKKQNNVLCEKVAVFLGDSICAGTTTLASATEYNYGWGGIIGEANKMSWENYGQNGAVISSSITSTNRYIANQVDSAYREHPAADYVIFEGGCNDADILGDDKLGEFSSSGYTTDDYSDFTKSFESLILKIMTTFPKAKIGYIVAHKMGASNDYSFENNRYRRFFDRAIEICEKWGIPYIDLWKTSPLNPMLSIHFDKNLTADEANIQGKLYTDGQHLTLDGYKRLAPKIESFMRNL